MGKNQGYKAMQRARVGSSSGSAAPDEIEDGMVDGSYHTPEWHAARLAGLQTTHTITWEEYKKKQKDEELKKGELEADTDKLMREYRAQLDAERAMKLSKGRNYSSDKSRKGRREMSLIERTETRGERKAKRESVREGIHLTRAPPQAHPPSHQAATKRSLEGQGRVQKDPKGRRNTNLKADTRGKAKMKMMVQCLYRNSLAILRRVDHT
uniref:Uncharacterized protein n=1 Tax=Brassica oleracea TaxID=3712 RepID=A0A3P6BQ23_BRAOL|nr:unnamed protein product [Brassica oleracea]